MSGFGDLPRFEWMEDGTVCARCGTQTNCAGIAETRVRIAADAAPGLTLAPSCGGEDQNRIGRHVPDEDVPQRLREAVFSGARDEYHARGLSTGLRFELLEALVHPVDANKRMFYLAARQALAGWLDRSSR
jgi:hypothetical protein